MNKKNLIETLMIQTISADETHMRAYIKKVATDIGGIRIHYHKGNIYLTKGSAEIFPCIVAHMDTVHEIYNGFEIFEAKGNLFSFDSFTMSQVGIGGDDKVGVFIALEMLRKFDNIKVAFFSKEEVGCVGSRKAKMKFFDDCAFVLQCDRQGNSDFVNSSYSQELFGEEFQHMVGWILKNYGYKSTNGGLTDVIQLKENGIEIAVANMSCGYYDPHSDTEYVNLADVENCHNMVSDIITQLGEYKHVHKPTFKYATHDGYYDGFGWDGYEGYEKGAYCGGNEHLNDDSIPAKIAYRTTYGWCLNCGDHAVKDEFENAYCNSCEDYLSVSQWITFEETEAADDLEIDEKEENIFDSVNTEDESESIHITMDHTDNEGESELAYVTIEDFEKKENIFDDDIEFINTDDEVLKFKKIG